MAVPHVATRGAVAGGAMWREAARQRIAIWKEIVWLVRKWLLGAYSVLAISQFIRDEFLIPRGWADWKLLTVLPSLPLWAWILSLAIILLATVLEGAYRAIAARDTRLRLSEATGASLAIVFGDGPDYEAVASFADKTERTFRVAVKNVGWRTIGRAHLDVERVTPRPRHNDFPPTVRLRQTNDRLIPAPGLPSGFASRVMRQSPPYKDEFPLDAGDTNFIDVVTGLDDREETILCSIIPGAGWSVIHSVPYELLLYAHGRDASPARRTFVVGRENGRLTLKPKP